MRARLVKVIELTRIFTGLLVPLGFVYSDVYEHFAYPTPEGEPTMVQVAEFALVMRKVVAQLTAAYGIDWVQAQAMPNQKYHTYQQTGRLRRGELSAVILLTLQPTRCIAQVKLDILE